MQRRTVLRSAVKLAYATPLVVASMQVPGVHSASAYCSCFTDPCYEYDAAHDCYRQVEFDNCELSFEPLCPD